MKTCPKCGKELLDSTNICFICNYNFDKPEPPVPSKPVSTVVAQKSQNSIKPNEVAGNQNKNSSAEKKNEKKYNAFVRIVLPILSIPAAFFCLIFGIIGSIAKIPFLCFFAFILGVAGIVCGVVPMVLTKNPFLPAMFGAGFSGAFLLALILMWAGVDFGDDYDHNKYSGYKSYQPDGYYYDSNGNGNLDSGESVWGNDGNVYDYKNGKYYQYK